MDPFRNQQPPTSRIVPSSPAFFGHPPPIGPPILDPLAMMIPPPYLAEIISMIRTEFGNQATFLTDQYASIKQGYADMAHQFKLYVRQTDNIIAEQDARLERTLLGIRSDIQQFSDGQTIANTTLEQRLGNLEALTKASRESLDSRIAPVLGMMEHGFNRVIRDEDHGGVTF